MKTVLVTGGRGFIGNWTVSELQKRGYDPLLLDRRNGNPNRVNYQTIYGDVRDANLVHDAMSHADAWIHLAGLLGTQETIQTPLPAAETNILGSLHMLEAAAKLDVPGVHIAVGNWWMNNTYSITKTTAERFCAMYAKERGLPVTVVRALNAYGPGQIPAAPYGPSRVRKIMPSFVCRALTKQPIEVYGDGQQIMDMIYVEDLAKILVHALEHTVKNGKAASLVEAGTGRHTSVLQIAEQVNSTAGNTAGITHLPMRPGEPEWSVVVGDPDTLAHIEYDDDLVSLEDGVTKTVRWYSQYWEGA